MIPLTREGFRCPDGLLRLNSTYPIGLIHRDRPNVYRRRRVFPDVSTLPARIMQLIVGQVTGLPMEKGRRLGCTQLSPKDELTGGSWAESEVDDGT